MEYSLMLHITTIHLVLSNTKNNIAPKKEHTHVKQSPKLKNRTNFGKRTKVT
uniref:Uncharacterized protein n=1 Tax=Arundo donax TaxID=35708 RepID=A0A0A9DZU3_ARUDO